VYQSLSDSTGLVIIIYHPYSNRFSAIRVDKPNRTSWEKKRQLKAEAQQLKLAAKELKEERAEKAKVSSLSPVFSKKR